MSQERCNKNRQRTHIKGCVFGRLGTELVKKPKDLLE